MTPAFKEVSLSFSFLSCNSSQFPGSKVATVAAAATTTKIAKSKVKQKTQEKVFKGSLSSLRLKTEH